MTRRLALGLGALIVAVGIVSYVLGASWGASLVPVGFGLLIGGYLIPVNPTREKRG